MRTRAFLMAALAVLLLTAAGANAQLINEFNISHTGTDTMEYIEIIGDPNTDYSNLTIVEIEGEPGAGTATGLIDDCTLAVGTTDANGYWDTGFQNNLCENGTLTLLLVDGYTGSVGDDLDTDDDGVFDSEPWSAIVDCIGINDGFEPLDIDYCSTTLGANYDGVSDFSPGGASRVPDGVDTDSIDDWVRNDFDLADLLPGTPEPGEALNTPSDSNDVVPGPITRIFGTCPSGITLSVEGGTPGGQAGILFASNTGSDLIPGGPCVGEESGLMGLGLLTLAPLDGNGEFSITASPGAGACSFILQTLDVDSCELTNVRFIPDDPEP